MMSVLSTDRSLVSLFQRAVLGIVISGHGAQKLLGWFGGGGWDGTQAYFASQGIPAALGALIILAESLGDRRRAGWVSGYMSACSWALGDYVAALQAELPAPLLARIPFHATIALPAIAAYFDFGRLR